MLLIRAQVLERKKNADLRMSILKQKMQELYKELQEVQRKKEETEVEQFECEKELQKLDAQPIESKEAPMPTIENEPYFPEDYAEYNI